METRETILLSEILKELKDIKSELQAVRTVQTLVKQPVTYGPTIAGWTPDSLPKSFDCIAKEWVVGIDKGDK
jgi:hypothetical protein